MPPFDRFFSALPAKVDDFALAEMRKIAETSFEILDLDSLTEDLLDAAEKIVEGPGIFDAVQGPVAAFDGTFARAFYFRLEIAHRIASPVYYAPESFDFRQESVCFFECEKSHFNMIEID